MRRSLLPIVLVTTITLSSSNVLPILSINKLDAEPLLDDQDSDNTFDVNPNIFYKIFIDTSKDNTPKKPLISRSKYMDNDYQDSKILNGKLESEDNDDEEFRKEQWHNYPRQLDRLNRNINVHTQFDKILLHSKDLERLKEIDHSRDDVNQYINSDLDNSADNIDGPLLILKIRLAYLNDDINKADSNKLIYSDLIPPESKTDDDVLNTNDLEPLTQVKRQGKSRVQDIAFSENSNDKKTVKKRIFSLLSRLQNFAPRGHELHHRRHLYALYGLPEDGTLTAETRGTMKRPPGSPLRWG